MLKLCAKTFTNALASTVGNFYFGCLIIITMKHLSFLLASLSLSILTLAQNVGIGTATPQYKLDVVGRMRIQAAVLNNPSTGSGVWFTDNRTNDDMIFVGMADSVNYGLWSNKPGIGWQFYYDARYGNVGIGRKPVGGTARLSVDHPSGASLNVYANGAYRGGFQATDTTLEIFGSYGSLFIGGSVARDIVIWPGPPPCPNPPCIGAATPGRIGMYTNAPTARVHVLAGTGASGMVIGTSATQPATGYMLNVDGKIICEELKVQLSTAWPDYVFEDNYKLPTIDQLEQQVMKQKHLPGIPSAASITAENGYEMGDMQTRLLEKIEELYRYVFELNKENKELKRLLTTRSQ